MTDLFFLLLVLHGFAPSLLKIFFKAGCIFQLGKKLKLFRGQFPGFYFELFERKGIELFLKTPLLQP